MDQTEKDDLIQRLTNLGASLPCARCGNNAFTLVDGYFADAIQPTFNQGIILGGPSIPSVGVVCNRCGFISHHALGILNPGSMVESDKKDNVESTEKKAEND